jgi:hypothetical protein
VNLLEARHCDKCAVPAFSFPAVSSAHSSKVADHPLGTKHGTSKETALCVKLTASGDVSRYAPALRTHLASLRTSRNPIARLGVQLAKAGCLVPRGSRADSGLYQLEVTNRALIVDLLDSERRVADCCSEGFVRTTYDFKERVLRAKRSAGVPEYRGIRA